MQISLSKDPPPKTEAFDWASQSWNAKWIEDPSWDRQSCHVCAFRRCFTLANARTVRVHLSGDQRYTLFLDGKKIGFGPERGDHSNWFYQTHDLRLSSGEHRIVAVVTWTAVDQGLSHLGHFGHKPSFILHAEGADESLFSTGIADWQVLTLHGITFTPAQSFAFCGVGGRTNIEAKLLELDYETGADNAGIWKPVQNGPNAFLHAHLLTCFMPTRQLRFSTLPPMYEKIISVGKVRHAQLLETADKVDLVDFSATRRNSPFESAFQALLNGKAPVEVPANTTLRILIDVGNYVCAWPMLSVSGGKDAFVKIDWAEALYTDEKHWSKGDRNEVEGKFFFGIGDSFTFDGTTERRFEPFWWEAGRYVRLCITTAHEPLTLKTFKLRETHYPHQFESMFSCSDSRWDNLIKISKRALEMCSHETYVDCPYYEQLMYVGDTRLEALTTYATTRDDRLPRKAVYLFDESRDQTGLTLSRTPSIESQIIPPFSLWWVMMVHDYAYWRNDLAFVRARMNGVRAVLEAFRANIREDHLVYGLLGWNFTDWVPAWRPAGIPPDGHRGANATINLQFVWVLRAAAELEDLFGEKDLAKRNRKTADEIAAAVKKHFWVPRRSLFAENQEKTKFSEHAQCMAVLGGSVPAGADITRALLESDDLERATIYFSHYLFETFRKLKCPDALYNRLPLWFEHSNLGLKTTVESPEPTRSDCHAWGAHPMFHAYATLAGIRPAAPGFSKIRITPQLGPLTSLRASMIHPSGGTIELDIAKAKDGRLHGTATVPAGIPASLTILPDAEPYLWTGGTCNF